MVGRKFPEKAKGKLTTMSDGKKLPQTSGKTAPEKAENKKFRNMENCRYIKRRIEDL